MDETPIKARLRGYVCFAVAMIAAGVFGAAAALALFCYTCVTKTYFPQITLYVYAGISAGVSFIVAGAVLFAALKTLERELS